MKNVQYVIWNDSYSVGVAAIDSQHQQVLKILNTLHSSSIGDGCAKDLENCMLKLWIFTVTHFQYEETLLRLLHYEKIGEHVKLHEWMKRETRRHLDDVKSGKGDFLETLHFVKEWWIKHINEEDRQYAALAASLEL
ncbi:MAG: hemerythrin family protein [Nitrospinae bacterium]|nr:hemerythrin family protein [Nitrospinota bacterium]